jgi:hypothetical protein
MLRDTWQRWSLPRRRGRVQNLETRDNAGALSKQGGGFQSRGARDSVWAHALPFVCSKPVHKIPDL